MRQDTDYHMVHFDASRMSIIVVKIAKKRVQDHRTKFQYLEGTETVKIISEDFVRINQKF